MMVAYVEGRPMPSSSTMRTKEPCVKLEGAWVKGGVVGLRPPPNDHPQTRREHVYVYVWVCIHKQTSEQTNKPTNNQSSKQTNKPKKPKAGLLYSLPEGRRGGVGQDLGARALEQLAGLLLVFFI